MNTSALKTVEIVQKISGASEPMLLQIQQFLDQLVQTPLTNSSRISLQGIWSTIGFENCADLNAEITDIRHELSISILDRDL